jgi:hypothetical protein
MRCPLVCHLLFFLPAWTLEALAADPSAREMCYHSCQISLEPPRFNDTDPASPRFAQSCLSRMKSVSLYLCLEVYCRGEYQTEGLSSLNRTCLDNALPPLPPFDIIVNYTDDVISGLRYLQRDEAVYTTILGEVVVPSERLFNLSYRTQVITTAASRSDGQPRG